MASGQSPNEEPKAYAYIESWSKDPIEVKPTHINTDLISGQGKYEWIIQDISGNNIYQLIIERNTHSENISPNNAEIWQASLYKIQHNKSISNDMNNNVSLFLKNKIKETDVLDKDMTIAFFSTYTHSKKINGIWYSFNPARPEKIFFGYPLTIIRIVKVDNFYCVMRVTKFSTLLNAPTKFQTLGLSVEFTNIRPNI